MQQQLRELGDEINEAQSSFDDIFERYKQQMVYNTTEKEPENENDTNTKPIVPVHPDHESFVQGPVVYRPSTTFLFPGLLPPWLRKVQRGAEAGGASNRLRRRTVLMGF